MTSGPPGRTPRESAVRSTAKSVETPTIWLPRPLQRYALAVAAPALALALSLILDPYLDRIVFMLFWPAVLVTAVIAGLGPALLASVLSVLAVDYWLISPYHTFHLAEPTDL